MLLGAFAAGVIAKLLLRDAAPHDARYIEAKLEGIGFGFFVPVFFIHTGLTFDLQALVSDPSTLLLLPVFLVLLLVVRGVRRAAHRAARLGRRGQAGHRAACATGLPIIVAVTGIGVDAGDLPVGTASALVGAGMLSVLLFPLDRVHAAQPVGRDAHPGHRRHGARNGLTGRPSPLAPSPRPDSVPTATLRAARINFSRRG